jgi:hypothetical protein
MKSLPKRLSRCAAITCIGLAGSAFAAFAQAPGAAKPGPVAPAAFTCATGELAFKNGNGTKDNFADTGDVADPTPHPTSQFATALQLNAATNKYDQKASDYRFGDSFTLNQSGPITKLRMTTYVKSNSSDSNNDGFSISTQPGFTPAFNYGFAQGLGSMGWGSLTFDFDRSVNQVKVNNAVATPPGYLAVNFFTDLDNGRALHVYVQDDTSVDFIQIEGCYKPPPPKYDLTASKKHEGSAYMLNVHNNGSQIMPTGKVDVVEVVPAGLTITSFPSGPWTCTGSLPVVGPDSFTCSYQIPSAGIATGANLPQIVLKSEGTPECPNCMRVKLYLKDVGGGVKPVDEGDMKNNVSCVK